MSVILCRSEAADVADLHRIRLSVRENRLTDPSRLEEADYLPFIDGNGETWHAIVEGQIAGFASLDQHDKSVWALFIDPAYEGIGLGKLLLTKLVDQARAAAIPTLSLVTTPGTRAETFYLRNGWKADGLTENGECRLILNLNG